MRPLLRFASSFSLAGLLTACSGQDVPPPAPAFADEAGFLDLEPVHVGFAHIGTMPADVTTPAARIFYAFQPAEDAPEDKPIFVFFNGGPGFATSLGLLAFNTGERSLDLHRNGGSAVGPSPRPWTAMGSLLYLDSREAGFSYQLGAPGDHPDERAAAFDIGTFNPFTDAADMLRAVLRFLDAHPALRDRPVILVGESYGGTRAAAMLNLAHHPERYEAADAFFHDPALAAEVRAHFAAAHPGEAFTPELAAAQFGRQILIEPAVVGKAQLDAMYAAFGQAGSTVAQLATARGLDCAPCAAGDAACDAVAAGQRCASALVQAGLDPTDLQQTLDEGNAILAAAEATLRSTDGLSALLGVDARHVDGLGAASRAGAFRVAADLPTASPVPSDYGAEPLAADLGALPAWDHYFLGQNDAVVSASVGTPVDWTSNLWGTVFMDNLQRVDTFITDAAYDGIISTPALAHALLTVPGVTSAALDDAPRPGVARPGTLLLGYTSPSGGPSQTLTIRMPHYDKSGHAVVMRQPVELADDVAAWLAEHRAQAR